MLDASPDFSQVYSKVRALLTDKDYLVLGHAVDSDVRMLNAVCARYHLPSIDFDFICSQLLYKLYRGDKEVKGLNKIANDLGITFRQHNSEEDAFVSMLTLKFLVEDSGLSVDELLLKYQVRKGSNANFELTRPVSLMGQVSKKKHTQLAIEKIKDYASTVKKTSNGYAGKSFCLARSLELSDSDELYAVVDAIVSRGGRYATKLFKGNYYVLSNTEASEVDVMREKRVDELHEQGLIQKVTINQVLEGKL